MVWSPHANREYERLLDYLITEFGSNTAIKFDRHVEEVLELISQHPQMYPQSEIKSNVHRCVLHQNTSLYYRIKNDKIELVSIWANKRNPKDLKL